MTTETRLDQVEYRLELMASRLRRLEVEAGMGEAEASQAPAATPPERAPAVQGPQIVYSSSSWPEPAPPPPRSASGASFEELFGGRVLAWIGGLAILLGAALFMGMAISRGWLDEETRTVIAMFGSLALLATGVWLHERKGRVEAALAAVASAISGLYLTLLVATQAYELIAPGPGLALAAAIAAIGLVIAVRWSSPIVAAIGALGALGAPILVGTGTAGVSIAFVAIALAATVGILIWQRWDWLALGAFTVSVPQLMAWVLANDSEHMPLVLPVMVGFWALYVAAAFGHELRSRADGVLPVASWLLLFGSSALVVAGGYHVFDLADDHTAAVVWVFGFALVHLLLGAIAMRCRIHREIGSLLIGTGVALTGFGLAEALDGPGLVAAWAGASAVLAFLATRVDATPDPALSSAERLLAAAGVFLALALGHTLLLEAPPVALVDGVEDLASAAAALVASAAAAFACQRFSRRIEPAGATVAAFTGAAALVYLGSVLVVDTVGVDPGGEARQVGQVWLSAFWTVTGLGAVVWGLVRRSADVRLGGLALLGVAIAKVWTYDLSELDELARVLSFVGLGLLLLVGSFAYQRIKPGGESEEREEEPYSAG